MKIGDIIYLPKTLPYGTLVSARGYCLKCNAYHSYIGRLTYNSGFTVGLDGARGSSEHQFANDRTTYRAVWDIKNNEEATCLLNEG